MKFLSKVVIFVTLACSSFIILAEALQEEFQKLKAVSYGVSALEPKLLELSRQYNLSPRLADSGKSSVTLNKTGYDVLTKEIMQENWVIKDFLSFATKAKSPILDVGAGYGGITSSALEKGASVIYNDIDVRHLLVGYRKIKDKHTHGLEKLYLNERSFPQETTFPNQSLSAVMLHRIIHFLLPDEIEKGFDDIRDWLEPGGRIYIVVMAPQHIGFRDWFLPIYNKRWSDGVLWPGNGLDVERALPDQAMNLPKNLHVMDERPLVLSLKKRDFIIEKVGFVSMKKLGIESNRDGREAFGVIASLPR